MFAPFVTDLFETRLIIKALNVATINLFSVYSLLI